MNTQSITTEKEYKEALARIEELFNIAPGDPEEDEFDLLCMLVKNLKTKTTR